MGWTADGKSGPALPQDLISASRAFEGSEDIAVARELAHSFLTDVQALHGLPVFERVMCIVELVVSELVTNRPQVRFRPLPADPGSQRRRH
ncbi:hypothetical protein [Streptomyces hydrogenans]|uniref:hypothetical protein n=1 Tax=Streptomyces hydrogenans TaxID=1873719 RepID=UPI003D7252D7